MWGRRSGSDKVEPNSFRGGVTKTRMKLHFCEAIEIEILKRNQLTLERNQLERILFELIYLKRTLNDSIRKYLIRQDWIYKD